MSKSKNKKNSKKSTKKNTKKNTKKKVNPLPIIAVVIIIAAAVSIIVPQITKDKVSTEGESQPAAENREENPEAYSNDIVIDESLISETATFYDYDADGTTVELFAVKASDGTTRLALNTCQVCNGSPYAYFVQEGSNFICQNCQNVFARDSIGTVHGGCNPIPITEENYEKADGTITISADYLNQFKNIFTTWKKF